MVQLSTLRICEYSDSHANQPILGRHGNHHSYLKRTYSIIAIEEVVCPGYVGSANEEVRKEVLGRAETLYLTVRCLAREELDQTF